MDSKDTEQNTLYAIEYMGIISESHEKYIEYKITNNTEEELLLDWILEGNNKSDDSRECLLSDAMLVGANGISYFRTAVTQALNKSSISHILIRLSLRKINDSTERFSTTQITTRKQLLKDGTPPKMGKSEIKTKDSINKKSSSSDGEYSQITFW